MILRNDEARMLAKLTERQSEMRRATVTERVSQSIYKVQLPNGNEVRAHVSGQDAFQVDQVVTIDRSRDGYQYTIVTRNPENEPTRPLQDGTERQPDRQAAQPSSPRHKKPRPRIPPPVPPAPTRPIVDGPLYVFDETANRLYAGSLTFATVDGDGRDAILRPVVSGGIVSSIAVVNGGSMYTSAHVTITGAGKGAAAHATIVGDAITGIVMDAQGNHYSEWHSRLAPEYFEVWGYVLCGTALYAVPSNTTSGGYYIVNPTTLAHTWINMSGYEAGGVTGKIIGRAAYDADTGLLWAVWLLSDATYHLRGWLPDGSATWAKDYTITWPGSGANGVVVAGGYVYRFEYDTPNVIVATNCGTGAETTISLPAVTPPDTIGFVASPSCFTSFSNDVFVGIIRLDYYANKYGGSLLRIDSGSNTIADEMSVGAFTTSPGPAASPTFYATANDGNVYVVGNDGGQYKISIFSNDSGGWRFVTAIDGPGNGLAIGDRLYFTDGASGDLTAVDPVTLDIVATSTPAKGASPALGAVLYKS